MDKIYIRKDRHQTVRLTTFHSGWFKLFLQLPLFGSVFTYSFALFLACFLFSCERVEEVELQQLLLPHMELKLDENYLFSPDSGLLIIGQSGLSNWQGHTGNFYSRWEYPSRVQMHLDQDEIFDDTVGLRIKASSGRNRAQKSFGLYWKEQYGKNSLNEPLLFPASANDRYKRLKLDGGDEVVRTAIIEEIIRGESDIHVAHRIQINLFINDTYYGIYNLQEMITRHYFQSHFNVDDDKIDFLTWYPEKPRADDGSYKQWMEEVIPLLSELDFTLDESVAQIGHLIDLSNFMDYFIVETFIFNYDWPVNNMKWWRAREGEVHNKWRFILNDMDQTYRWEHVRDLWLGDFFVNTENRKHLYEDGFFVFNKFMQNASFRMAFFERYLQVIDHVFEQTRVEAIVEDHIQKTKNDYRFHARKWGYLGPRQWQEDLRSISVFNKERINWLRPKISEWYLSAKAIQENDK